jgi:anti-anti-sigma factor
MPARFRCPSRRPRKPDVSCPVPSAPHTEGGDDVLSGALEIKITRAGPNETTVAVSGEIDIATAPELERFLSNLTDGDVAVDLSGVPFLDSAGVKALINASRATAENGHRLATFGEQPAVRRVFNTLGVTDVLHGDGPTDG